MDKITKLCDSTTSRSNEKNINYNSINEVNEILAERLQYIQLDRENNINEELANKYNEDGNLYFMSCKYEQAIICFQEGLSLDFQNNQLRANMWNNLSAVHYFLKNYRSSLVTAEEVLKLMPGYEIAFIRGINCCIHMKDFNKSLFYCHIYLGNLPEYKKIEMEKSLVMNIEEQRVLKEINKRELYVVGQKGGDIIGDIKILNTDDPDVIPRVHLTENQRLVWSVLFLCPEQNASIVVTDFHEDATFYKMLGDIFSERAPWDAEGIYTADTINIYSEIPVNTTTRVLQRVHPEYTLSNVLTLFRCPIQYGLPTFMIAIYGGNYDNEYFEDYDNVPFDTRNLANEYDNGEIKFKEIQVYGDIPRHYNHIFVMDDKDIFSIGGGLDNHLDVHLLDLNTTKWEK
ncbi:Tetratricopeptide repeat,Tetratricopeptide repeat-containing domain,Tetratricopeptide-like helical [Cinara cedri]|uniref:Tetratricopeptide repeat,Tetratricopeptide repeat-containing domain,Tetratricopeptide-like helical n=1 Tax=Cinara cedri TaxID=506608 RepID=A0A5E4MNF6_9HEMI|nr:Tetratricopeptide repeat,Tetratricopeptide repeat-containing domain,Tetratricopeptide-like helical [Cinara cedri]